MEEVIWRTEKWIDEVGSKKRRRRRREIRENCGGAHKSTLLKNSSKERAY